MKLICNIQIAMVLLIGLILFNPTINAQEHLSIPKGLDQIFIPGKYIQIYVDSSNSKTIEEIISPKFQSRFEIKKENIPIVEQGGIHHWVKVSIDGEGLLSDDLVLENLVYCTHYLEAYIVDESGLIKSFPEHGMLKKFDTRSIAHKNFVYTLPKKQKFDFYFKIWTNHSVYCAFKVKSLDYYSSYSLKEYFYLSLLYGMILIMILINLIFYFWFKEKLILSYCLYATSAIFFFFSEDGLGFQFLWPNIPSLNYWIVYYSPIVFLAMLINYSNQFLQIRERWPKLFSTIWITAIVGTILYVISVLQHKSQGSIPLFYISFIFIYIAAFLAARKGDLPERLFLLGNTITLIGLLLFVSRRYLMLDVNWSPILLFYAINIGVLIELFLFYLAQFRKLNYEKLEKDRKVSELSNRFAHIFQNSVSGIIIYDLNTRNILECNKTAIELLRLNPKSEQHKNTVCTFFNCSKININESFIEMTEILSKHNGVTFESTIKNSDDEKIYAEISITHIKINELKYGVLSIQDIRERKQAEIKLKENLEMLSKSNKKLKAYIDSNNELEQFAYAVSHDLKQPVRTISSFTSLLKKNLTKRNILNEADEEYLNFISTGTKNMTQLINGLLEYSKIGGQKNDTIETFNFQDLMVIIQSNLSGHINDTNAKVIFENIPQEVLGVRVKLLQLFQNLISNSIKFQKKNIPPTIKISCEETEEEFLFTLQDNGMGIPKENRKTVFELFKKAHSKNIEGSGIGLATCKRIVNQHGGRIWVNPDFEDGTIFYFSIKKNYANNEDEIPTQQQEDAFGMTLN